MIYNRWIRHIVFWILCLLVMTVYLTGSEYTYYKRVFILLVSGIPVFILYNYFTIYFTIPWALKKNRYVILVSYFIFTSIIFGLIFQVLKLNLYYRFFEPEVLQKSFFLHYKAIAMNIVWINTIFLMFASAKLVRDYLIEQKKEKELEKINTEAELSLLSTQLHPHFLFNTLNNLYCLALSGSAKTTVGLQKIKGLMSYILFECGQPEISLRKEINLIDNYIELEKLRYGKRLNVTFDVFLENEELLIAPMILLTFIENCFKHGSSKATGNSFINIFLSNKGNNLIFHAENSVPDFQQINPDHKGLGLENITKRLEFLYPGHHSLSIIREEHIFRVVLIIENLKINSPVKPVYAFKQL